MNTSFLIPEGVRAEMRARYDVHPGTQDRPGSSLDVIRRVRARVRAARNAR